MLKTLKLIKRLAAGLALALLTAGISWATRAPHLDATAQREVVAKAAGLLRDNYVFPEVADRAGKKITDDLAAGDYASLGDPAAFVTRLTADLQSVSHDKHMRVIIGGGPLAILPKDPPSFGGIDQVDRLAGGVGYIHIARFGDSDIFDLAANDLMRKVSDARALIIDLRDCPGGDGDSTGYFASFFFDAAHPRPLTDVVWRKGGTLEFHRDTALSLKTPAPYLNRPVYVLVGPKTASGAEAVAYNLQAQKRAVIIGETTAGAANGDHLTPPISAIAARSQVGPLIERRLFIPRTKPQPGGAAVLRRTIAGLISGAPAYELMTKTLANETRPQLADIQKGLGATGPLRSMAFKRIGALGEDVYEVKFATKTMEWFIFLGPDGKLSYFDLRDL